MRPVVVGAEESTVVYSCPRDRGRCLAACRVFTTDEFEYRRSRGLTDPTMDSLVDSNITVFS